MNLVRISGGVRLNSNSPSYGLTISLKNNKISVLVELVRDPQVVALKFLFPKNIGSGGSEADTFTYLGDRTKNIADVDNITSTLKVIKAFI